MSEGCRGCTGHCCRDIVVHVTPFDVSRIAAAQSLDPLQIVEPRETVPGDGQNGEAFGARIDATGRLFSSVLRKGALDQSACQFLVHLDEDHARCGIYADRPRVCIIYPFVVRQGSIDVRGDARCGPGDWNMARLDYASVRRELAAYSAEWHACARIVEAWNGAVEQGNRSPSFASFTSFAHRVAGAVASDTSLDVGVLERWDEAQLSAELETARRAWLDHVSIAAQSAIRE